VISTFVHPSAMELRLKRGKGRDRGRIGTDPAAKRPLGCISLDQDREKGKSSGWSTSLISGQHISNSPVLHQGGGED